VEDEGGDGDASRGRGRRRPEVVVGCAGEAGVEGGDALVEVAQRLDAVGAGGVVDAGKEHGFAAKAFEQGGAEIGARRGGWRADGGRRRRRRDRARGDADDGAQDRAAAEVASSPSSPASLSTRLPPME
jgi:hypothetical protein